MGPEASALTGELSETIDAGLAEARQAVAALRQSSGSAGTLGDMIAGAVDDFADRFGLRVEFECESGLPALSPRAQAETLRIAQEALTNVRRHADATMVRVKVGVDAGRLTMVVGDNGCGFEPEAAGRQGFGLGSMRERAALIGGELCIDSRPHDGTRITLAVPVDGVAAVGAP
jgi:signal transduction histidine kinase